MVAELDIVVRLFLAAMLGAIIGYERDKSRKPFGMRTSMLITVATATFAISMADFNSEEFARLLPAIVTGVGFLGAGAILKSSDGKHVLGMTTAATLWALAGIGYAVGAGMLFLPVAATLMVFGILMLKHFNWRME